MHTSAAAGGTWGGSPAASAALRRFPRTPDAPTALQSQASEDPTSQGAAKGAVRLSAALEGPRAPPPSSPSVQGCAQPLGLLTQPRAGLPGQLDRPSGEQGVPYSTQVPAEEAQRGRGNLDPTEPPVCTSCPSPPPSSFTHSPPRCTRLGWGLFLPLGPQPCPPEPDGLFGGGRAGLVGRSLHTDTGCRALRGPLLTPCRDPLAGSGDRLPGARLTLGGLRGQPLAAQSGPLHGELGEARTACGALPTL